MTTRTPTPLPNLIACLESYINPALPIGTSLSNDPSAPALHILPSSTLSKLKNVGPARAKDMRSLGHSRQILSHIPVPANATACAKFNDALYASIQLNSEKLEALAMLPANDGREAARELARCVGKGRFVGGVLGVGTGGVGLLDEGFEEVWSVAEKYRVPVVLREMWPSSAELAEYQAGLADTMLAPVATHMHTAHNHSPLKILHLYLSSVFDRHPNLRLIISHPGLLPSLLPRIEAILDQIPAADKPKRPYLDVWQHNFYLTTTDVLDISTMRTLLEQIPIDRVLYVSNYPLEERGREIMDELKDSGFLTNEEWERVAWKNAELLFNLKNSGSKGGSAKRM
ncbi:amidohydrolase 2 [Setomelanomma holmii]|uniref:Amidohydrolase 2 n=1 Tax=Setomelanomma holmii TaxID=210430 RepID=A0A9P4H9P5_9PLEO|nr:amidohydrolase 2 [Setomelanomma holmii]